LQNFLQLTARKADEETGTDFRCECCRSGGVMVESTMRKLMVEQPTKIANMVALKDYS
jgi:hypothetical protein